MSRLIYNGDTNTLFGNNLPTPRIDAVKITDVPTTELNSLSDASQNQFGTLRDTFGIGITAVEQAAFAATDPFFENVLITNDHYATVRRPDEPGYEFSPGNDYAYIDRHMDPSNWNKLEIDISFLFNSDDTFDPSELMKELFDFESGAIDKPSLWINLIFIRDKDMIDKMKAGKGYISEVREMILNYTENWTDSRKGLTDDTRGIGGGGRDCSPGLYKVSIQEQKMSNFSENVSSTAYTDAEGNTIYKVSNITLTLYVRGMPWMSDASIFAVTSVNSLNSMAGASKAMLQMNYGDITYEDYMKDGKLTAFGDPLYIDSDEIPCISTPIRAMDGRYYKTEEYGEDQMYKELVDLINPYVKYQIDHNDQTLRLCTEGIVSTAAQYTNNVTFLEKLTAFQRFWPGKNNSSKHSSKAAELLLSYEVKLSNFNARLRDQKEVFKKIYRNYKFMDQRLKPPLNLTPSSWSVVTDTTTGESVYQDLDLKVDHLLPPTIFHSAMAKFQPTSAITNDLMQAEIPVTAAERDQAFESAITELMTELGVLINSTWNAWGSYMGDSGEGLSGFGAASSKNVYDTMLSDMAKYIYAVSELFVDNERGWSKYYKHGVKGDLHESGAGCGEKCYGRPGDPLASLAYWTSKNYMPTEPSFEIVVPRISHEWTKAVGMGSGDSADVAADAGGDLYVDSEGSGGADEYISSGLGDSSNYGIRTTRIGDIWPWTTETYKRSGDTERKAIFLKISRRYDSHTSWKSKVKDIIENYLTSLPYFDAAGFSGNSGDFDPMGNATFSEVVNMQVEGIGNDIASMLEGEITTILSNLDSVLNDGAASGEEGYGEEVGSMPGSPGTGTNSGSGFSEMSRQRIADDMWKSVYGYSYHGTASSYWMYSSTNSFQKLGGTLKTKIGALRQGNPFNFFIRANPDRQPGFSTAGSQLAGHLGPYLTLSSTGDRTDEWYAAIAGADYTTDPAPGQSSYAVGSGGAFAAAGTGAAVAIWDRAIAVRWGGSNANPQHFDGGNVGLDKLEWIQVLSDVSYVDTSDWGGIGRGAGTGYDTEYMQPMIRVWNFGTVIADALAQAFIDIRHEMYNIFLKFAEIAVAYGSFQMDSGMYKALNNVDILVKKGGYFFYDLEKHIRKQSYISRFINVDAMLNSMPYAYEMTNLGIGVNEVSVAVRPHAMYSAALGGEAGWYMDSPHFGGTFLEPDQTRPETTDWGWDDNIEDHTPSMELKISEPLPHAPHMWNDVRFTCIKHKLATPGGWDPVDFSGIDVSVQYYGFASPYNGIATFNDLFVSENEFNYIQAATDTDAGGALYWNQSAASMTANMFGFGTGGNMEGALADTRVSTAAALLFSPMPYIEPTGEYSMLLPRVYNFNQFSNKALEGTQTWRGNYRLAMFQYQYFMDDDDACAWNYSFDEGGRPADDKCIDPMRYQVTVTDHSFYVLIGLFDEFIQTYEDFYENYFLVAHEYCAYDDFSGRFNDFFAESITARYPDLMAAPWMRMAATYVYFLDIFSNAYGKNRGFQIEAAQALLATIRPETGNLSAVDNLEMATRKMKEFFEHKREQAIEAFEEDAVIPPEKTVYSYLCLEDDSDRSEMPHITRISTKDIVHAVTIYDHIGDYSSVASTTGNEHDAMLTDDEVES